MPGLCLICSSTDEKAQLTVCNTRGAVYDLTKRTFDSGVGACAPTLSKEAWRKREAPRAKRSLETSLSVARRGAAAGTTTQTLSRGEDATTVEPLRTVVREDTSDGQGQQNDPWFFDFPSGDVQPRSNARKPGIVLAWFVRRQCPAPTPETAHILMAVGNR